MPETIKQRKFYAYFFNYPYYGWIGVFLFFLLATIGLDMYSSLPSTEGKNYTKINEIITQRIDSSEQFLHYLEQTKNIDSIYNKDYNGTIYIVYDNKGKAINWNYNLINSDDAYLWVRSNPENRFISLNNYNILIKSIDIDTLKVVTIIPISYNVNNNKNVLNIYNAKLNIDVERPIKIDQYYFEGSHVIKYKEKTLFHIQFEKYISITITIITFFAFIGLITSFIIWLYHFYSRILKNIDFRIGIAISILFLEVFKRFFDLQFILPDVLLNIKLFDEQFLATSSNINSFGEFILYVLLFNMLFGIITSKLLDNIKPSEYPQKNQKQWDVALNIIFILTLHCYSIINTEKLIEALIMDSRLVFNFSAFQFLDIYGILGLLSHIFIVINYVLILNLVCKITEHAKHKKAIDRFILISVYVLCGILIYAGYNIWVIIAIIILNTINYFYLNIIGYPFKFQLSNKFQSFNTKPNWYWWFIIISVLSTCLMILNNAEKEHVIRENYAQKFLRKVDPMLEFDMMQLGENMANDYQIKNNIRRGSDNQKVFKYISSNYIKNIVGIGDYEITILDANKAVVRNSFNNEIFNIQNLNFNESNPDVSINYVEDLTNKYIYHFVYTVFENKEIIGYIVISEFNIRSDNTVNDIINSIRSKNNNYADILLKSYTTGYYQQGKLLSDYGNSQMPTYYNTQGITTNTYKFDTESSDLIFPYDVEANKYLIVRYERNLIILIVTNFTYVMIGVFLLWISINFIYISVLRPQYIKYYIRNLHLSIRNKINFTIWGTVFLSFIIIGIFTVYIFKKNEHEYNTNYLREKNLLFTQSIAQYDLENDKEPIKYLINFYAREMNLLINIYNDDGFLIYNSDHYLNENNFISNLMNHEVKKNFEHNNSTFIITNYIVNHKNILKNSYVTLRDAYFNKIGYVNIINLNNHNNENGPTSDLLLALINLYILIFIITSIVASLISNNVIKSFNLLINKFRKFNLKNNETITWPYKDEVGLLIDEYNKMIKNVEQLANKLAMRERETVWREIAQQVAHEIKNPLTPMKLQIQYLQNAIQSNRSDIDVLTNRVCGVIIDQIDSLNEIATAFSNFAKTPEANPEMVEVVTLLNKSIRLFDNENHIKFIFNTNYEQVYVFIDKNFISRALTNLIKNAIQAMPENREGLIAIKLLNYKGYVYIEIEDNGIGIKPEEQNKIFSPYFTTKSSGTGIGLNMTKNIIESAGGKITFKSTEGVGTKFMISLPEYRPNNRDHIKY